MVRLLSEIKGHGVCGPLAAVLIGNVLVRLLLHVLQSWAVAINRSLAGAAGIFAGKASPAFSEVVKLLAFDRFVVHHVSGVDIDLRCLI